MHPRMSLSAKLAASFATLIVLVLLVSIGAVAVISSLVSDTEALNRAAHGRLLSMRIMSASGQALSAERGIMLRSILQQAGGVERHKQEFRDTSAAIEQSLSEIQQFIHGELGRASVDGVRSKHQALLRAHEELVAAIDKQQFDQVQKISEERVQPRAQEIMAESQILVKQQTEATNQATQRASGRSQAAYWIIGALIAVTVLVAAALWLMLRRSNGLLKGLAAEMADGAAQVAAAASQVAQASQSLAQAASEQAATLEETGASSQHLAGMTRDNLGRTQEAAQSVQVSAQQIEATNDTLETMVSSMQEITASSGKISRIIKVIDEIAFQTNILALNAAVEAARAGEAGMGFAVVADEVRNLAQRCAQAAKDTAELIEDSIEKSNGGQAKLSEVVAAIRAITESSARIKTLVEKVSHSSMEQSRSIEQISTSVGQMQRVTQSTAANAEESAASSEQMSAQAEAMKGAVDRLYMLIGGGDSIERAVHAPRPKLTAMARRAERELRRMPVYDKTTSTATAVKDPFPMEGEFKEF